MAVIPSCVTRVAACLLLAAAPGLASAAAAVEADARFRALAEAAVPVRQPERSVLLASAQAGRRLVSVGERGVVLLSDDDGKRWRQARAVPVAVTLTAVTFADARQGWSVGHGGVVLHTADGGETWSRQIDGRGLAQVALAAAQKRVQEQPADERARQQLVAVQALAADGPEKPLFDVVFADARHGWIVGAYNLFFETRDGGVTWHSLMDRLDNPRSAHLHVLRRQGAALYVAGEQGVLFGSQDGGASFRALKANYEGSWFSLAVLDDGAVVIGGLRGNLMISRDRGANWRAVAGVPPISIMAATALPDHTLLLCNQAGQLLRLQADATLAPVAASVPPAPAGLLSLADGTLLTVGLTGVQRIPAVASTTSLKQ